MTVKVISKRNGGTYVIEEAKFKAEPNDWVLIVEDEVIKEEELRVEDTKVEEVKVEETKVEEETKAEEGPSYKELKIILSKKGIGFKGNASKEQLMNLLNES